ncbi:mitochondral 37S ribosomal protein S27 [Lobaria immixta]|nr:mitochondral 37S ribosomal protein S27 [Lobaria immixta]
MAVARSRILDLLKIQCRIFSMTYNPERIRTGNKILRERLKGPSIAEYYPRRAPTVRDLKKLFPDLDTWDDDEEDRLEALTLFGFLKRKRSAKEEEDQGRFEAIQGQEKGSGRNRIVVAYMLVDILICMAWA